MFIYVVIIIMIAALLKALFGISVKPDDLDNYYTDFDLTDDDLQDELFKDYLDEENDL